MHEQHLVVFILIRSSYLPPKISPVRVSLNATVEKVSPYVVISYNFLLCAYVIDIVVKYLNDIIEKQRPEDARIEAGKCQVSRLCIFSSVI